MKRARKLVSFLLVLAMALTMSTVAFADTSYSLPDGFPTSGTVTITGANDGETYAAYQIMKETPTGVADDGEPYVEFAIPSDFKSYVLQAINAYDSTVDTEAEDFDAAGYLLNNTSVTGYTAIEDYTAFATAMYEAFKDVTPTYTATADEDGYAKFEEVDDGYYLIIETTESKSDSAYTAAILTDILFTETRDSYEIAVKSGSPTMTMKVKNTNQSTGVTSDWQDMADSGAGDVIEFQLTASNFSDYMDSYESYVITFHDTMDTGMVYANKITVYVDGIEVAFDSNSVKVADGRSFTDSSSSTYEYTEPDDQCTIEITLDLKNLSQKVGGEAVTVTKESTVTVVYQAKLVSNQYTGSQLTSTGGFTNQAYLEYSNDPYDADSTAVTASDYTTVITYYLQLYKIDDTGAELEGAKFTLYKWMDNGNNDGTGYWESRGTQGGVNDMKSLYWFTGLDDGFYKLEENTAPSGYVSVDDVYFVVDSTLAGTMPESGWSTGCLEYFYVTLTNANQVALETSDTDQVKITSQSETGYFVFTIADDEKSVLPSTGGIGTTIFYIIGAILVIGAVVLLITRFRVKK